DDQNVLSTGGLTITSQQGSVDSPISTSITGTEIGSNIAGSTNIADSSVVVSDNRVLGSATGNRASNSIAVSGVAGGGDDGGEGSGTLNAAIANGQYSEAVSATLSGNRIGITGGDNELGDSLASVSDNSLVAAATANV